MDRGRNHRLGVSVFHTEGITGPGPQRESSASKLLRTRLPQPVFTPRYVVEFLTDNTLGRIWYDMRKGDTILPEQCRYMVRRPNEIFLAQGQTIPQDVEESTGDLSQDERLKQPVYIPHRPKQYPRDLKILDSACGSGHFVLYCFDLLQTIYEEAYDDPDLGRTCRRTTRHWKRSGRPCLA